MQTPRNKLLLFNQMEFIYKLQIFIPLDKNGNKPYSSSQLFCVLWRTEILKTQQIKVAVFIIIHVKRFSLVFFILFFMVFKYL